MSAPLRSNRGRGQEDPQTGGGGGAPSRGSAPEPPSKLILQNSLRNSDLDGWGYGWEHVSHRLELILLILRDREVGVWGRRYFASPRLREREEGAPGEGFLHPPALSVPYELAYVSSLTNQSGVGSGGTSNWGRGRSPLPRFGSRGSNFGITPDHDFLLFCLFFLLGSIIFPRVRSPCVLSMMERAISCFLRSG